MLKTEKRDWNAYKDNNVNDRVLYSDILIYATPENIRRCS